MSLEIPPKEVIDGEIILINQELILLGSVAEAQGLKPVKPALLLAADDGYTGITETTSPAAFWNHYIGGVLAAIDVQMYFLEETGRADEEVVSIAQGRLYRLATNWAEHPAVKNDALNKASSDAFLKAGFSFEWMKGPSLTRKLKDQVTDLGDFYTMREGYIPLSFTSMQRKSTLPSRAFIKCSNP